MLWEHDELCNLHIDVGECKMRSDHCVIETDNVDMSQQFVWFYSPPGSI
jgi:hypothetical protein